MVGKERYTDKDLQNPDFWDWDSAELHLGVPQAAAVVSVRFTSEELGHVETRALRMGKRLTEFIRDAALEKACAAVGDEE